MFPHDLFSGAPDESVPPSAAAPLGVPASSPLLAGLNPEQLAAVTLPPQHALILAGAGTGKTRALTTRLAAATVREGEAVDLAVRVASLRDEGLPMTVAVVGLPGGLEARADQLREFVKDGRIDAFELRGRDVALYWRCLAPRAEKAVPLSLLAAVPGRYVGPASRAYLYYGDDVKAWATPVEVTITA